MLKGDFRAKIDSIGDRVYDFWFEKNIWRFQAVLALLPAAPWLLGAKWSRDQGHLHEMAVNLLIALGFWLLCFLLNARSDSYEGPMTLLVLSVIILVAVPIIEKIHEKHIHPHRHHAATSISRKVFIGDTTLHGFVLVRLSL